MQTKNSSGLAVLVVVLAVALLGGGLLIAKPKFLSGASKRASASTAATARLATATNKQGAEAAASVVKIGEANTEAPVSLERVFIGKEVPVALAKLPSPDPLALLESEKRKSAILEGRAQEAESLYARELLNSAALERERLLAIAARHAADIALEQSAALGLGMERQRNLFMLAAAAAAALWLWVKLTHPSPGAIADAINEIRQGENPLAALNFITNRTQQRLIKRKAKMKAPDPIDPPSTGRTNPPFPGRTNQPFPPV